MTIRESSVVNHRPRSARRGWQQAVRSLRRRYGDAIHLDRAEEENFQSSVYVSVFFFLPNQCTNDGFQVFALVCVLRCGHMQLGMDGTGSNWELQSAWQDLCWASQPANKTPYMHACMHVQSARPLNPSNCRCFMLHCCAGPACTQ